MATPPLMSERGELHGTRWLDCAYASAMMLAWKWGIRAFPLGWTDKEREALERSDSRADETSANFVNIEEALRRRYRIIPSHTTDIGKTLRGPATTGIQLFGLWSSVPKTYRRWTAYLGGHSVYAEPVGDGVNCLMHDPLAPKGTAPLKVPASVLTKFALTYGTQQQLVVTEPVVSMLTLTDKTPRLIDSTVGVQLWKADGTTPLVKLSSGVLAIASPAKYADAAGRTYYSLVITMSGEPKLAWIKAADASVVPQTASVSVFNDGVTAASAAALTAKR